MRDSTRLISYALWIPAVLSLSCSSSGNLRKFDDADIGQATSSDVAKKFEVKDSADPVPSPTPIPELTKKKTKKKHQKMKKDEPAPPVLEAKAVPPNRHIDPEPFQVGERLQYDIRYVGVTAGYFSTEVLPDKFVNDRRVYHLQAKAKTVKLFELIYRVDDSIESFFDYDGLFSHRFTMNLDESKQTRKLIELYDYDKKQSFFWNRIDHVKNGFKEEKSYFDIPLWAQDPLSSLFFLRTVKLPTNTTDEFKFPVILDGKPWEVRLKFKKREKIYAGDKDREADVYQLDTYQNGELKNKDNTIWLSTDEHRYLLRVEAKVKVGSFAIALDKVL